MKVRVLGIDPGGTTGVLYAYVEGREVTPKESLEFPWTERFHLYAYIERIKPDVIVIESFRLYANSASDMIGSDFPSVQVIGAIEATVYKMYGSLKCINYQPAANMHSVKILQEHEPFFTRASEHRKDAYKHVRYYAVVNDNRLKTKGKGDRSVFSKAISTIFGK